MDKEARDELVAGLKTIQAGIAKLAELSAPKAAEPSEEDQKLATSIASKIAEMGFGSAHNIPDNAATFLSSHSESLRCTDHLLQLLGSTDKTASSPSQLGEAVASSNSSSARQVTRAYKPPRC